MNKWLQATKKLDAISADKVPAGWITLAEYADEIGLGRTQAGRKMTQLVDHGVAEVKAFKILTKRRGVYPTAHYRLK